MYFLNVFIVAILKLYTDIVIQFFFYLQILPLQTFSKKKEKKRDRPHKEKHFFLGHTSSASSTEKKRED